MYEGAGLADRAVVHNVLSVERQVDSTPVQVELVKNVAAVRQAATEKKPL